MFKKLLKKMEDKIIRVSGREYSPRAFSFEQCLVIFSKLFQILAGLRLGLYAKGILRSKQLPCFVISVGNIVAGGSGKTPMVMYLAKQLQKMGRKVVIVSRGYKAKTSKGAVVVTDGKTIFLSEKNCGDEPYMMAKHCNIPIVVGKDRFLAGSLAVKEFSPDIILLDDGFQHVKLKRNLDLLLFDYAAPLGNHRMLPAGRLRETPEMAAKRADVVILTRCPQKEEQTPFGGAQLKSHLDTQPFFKTFHKPYLHAYIRDNNHLFLTDPFLLEPVKNKNALLFSGIANNRSFYDGMDKLGVNILDHLEFSDHYRYKKADILGIRETAFQKGADLILTTQKDFARLDENIEWEMDLAVIGIQLELEKEDQFISFLKSTRI
ncbi:MAG: tetraacyldisaccharide 4'-kinase [Desulfobacteraceae bacterium]|nr:tetraacyldisaccharide 4'-kinase [Desulfobacteraceae bacterium]